MNFSAGAGSFRAVKADGSDGSPASDSQEDSRDASTLCTKVNSDRTKALIFESQPGVTYGHELQWEADQDGRGQSVVESTSTPGPV